MILVLTKERHVSKIRGYLESISVEAKIVMPSEVARIYLEPDIFPNLPPYSLGVSYCWPFLVTKPMLDQPRFGWINYHPAPLPEYPGPKETTRAIADRVTHWGVTVHKMDEQFDNGPIIKSHVYPLWEPPTSEAELGAVAHWHLFKLFKDTVYALAQGENPTSVGPRVSLRP